MRWPSLIALCLLAACARATPPHVLDVSGFRLQVEIADTPEARSRGLMHRTALAADAGMLFVFETPGRHCFWMKDTLLPLTLAFLDDRGRVLARTDMQPRSLELHCPPADVRLALEVAQTSPARARLAPGMTVSGLPVPR